MIPTRVHGYIDYVYGIVLILAPFIFGFANGGAAQWIPIIIGLCALGMALFTDYEVSVKRVIPMSTHIGVDIVAGLFLAVSPWLFGFSDLIWWPHLIFGIAVVGVAAMTSRHPSGARTDRVGRG